MAIGARRHVSVRGMVMSGARVNCILSGKAVGRLGVASWVYVTLCSGDRGVVSQVTLFSNSYVNLELF